MLPLERIRAATERASPHLRRTPVVAAGDGTLLKLECLQVTGAYKVRGFFAAALALPPERRARGLLTVSSGNAALACAHVAHELDIRCRTVMPPKGSCVIWSVRQGLGVRARERSGRF